MSRPFLPVLALAIALSACATVPAPLVGQFSTVQPEQAAASQTPGESVRWGGRIVDIHTEKLYTCFEVVGAPLDSSGRPRQVDESTGRFLACRSGFDEINCSLNSNRLHLCAAYAPVCKSCSGMKNDRNARHRFPKRIWRGDITDTDLNWQ